MQFLLTLAGTFPVTFLLVSKRNAQLQISVKGVLSLANLLDAYAARPSHRKIQGRLSSFRQQQKVQVHPFSRIQIEDSGPPGSRWLL